MVNGTDQKNFKFIDDEIGQEILVNLQIQEGIKLKLLERIHTDLVKLRRK